eukprot:gene4257-6323_t
MSLWRPPRPRVLVCLLWTVKVTAQYVDTMADFAVGVMLLNAGQAHLGVPIVTLGCLDVLMVAVKAADVDATLRGANFLAVLSFATELPILVMTLVATSAAEDWDAAALGLISMVFTFGSLLAAGGAVMAHTMDLARRLEASVAVAEDISLLLASYKTEEARVQVEGLATDTLPSRLHGALSQLLRNLQTYTVVYKPYLPDEFITAEGRHPQHSPSCAELCTPQAAAARAGCAPHAAQLPPAHTDVLNPLSAAAVHRPSNDAGPCSNPSGGAGPVHRSLSGGSTTSAATDSLPMAISERADGASHLRPHSRSGGAAGSPPTGATRAPPPPPPDAAHTAAAPHLPFATAMAAGVRAFAAMSVAAPTAGPCACAGKLAAHTSMSNVTMRPLRRDTASKMMMSASHDSAPSSFANAVVGGSASLLPGYRMHVTTA